MYPYPYRFVSLKDLHDQKSVLNDSNVNIERESSVNNDEGLSLKTYRDLKRDYDKFYSFSKNKKQAKDCYSTVNLRLFKESDDTLIIEKCVISEFLFVTRVCK